MKLEPALLQKQTLNLTMTQELQQAITILQYTAHELTAFLEMKEMDNPLIQLESPIVRSIDPRYDKVRKRKVTNPENDQKKWLEQIAEPTEGLADHLFSQLLMKALSDFQEKLVEQFIYNLDPNGYLMITIEEAAAICGTSIEEAEEILQLVQSLEPAGVAARSLQECLVLQVERRSDAPELAIKLLTEYFNEFAEKKWKVLSENLDVSLKEIQQAADFITTLDPRPGTHFDYERPQYVIPDLILEIIDGKLELQLFERHLPAIRYQADYYNEMASIADDKVKQYLNDKRQDFRWIMRSIEQRKQTLMKVGMAIIEEQQDFFLKGPRYLKPLTLKDVAEKIEVHESTVSRAIRGKYIQTPSGMHELKKFFSQALQVNAASDGEQASAGQAKTLIKGLIDKEDKSKPLSDQAIANMLKDKGLTLSRRTVAKYREQLRIPSSTKRKRYE
ncbi:RNA polymerase sigma-54 factor [Siminovitchia terrae]|uniref:RNA polymerase sigma-54 factor n=1 Tax=Siminovitchia terrae TaxID=1914933 RepID=A0A429X533_SIMTE|nr:RNA polymerase factor sigma-54 [Siminovitchia terrae]RST58489.1 RNA polymerase sigma-54 factor [Siminovitchia terrae]GIN89113.1 RNA polymerase sigma-54 factor [Siminovitchia terrae]GIN95182.1 RNA polymerase sigma-54 factor [Siminovitchia terrae]